MSRAAPSDRVVRLAAAAADLGLTVNDVATHLAEVALRSGVGRPTRPEVTQLRRRLDYLTLRRGKADGRCSSCQAPVVWAVTTAGGRPMPLDPLPHPKGNVTIERTAAGGVLATVHSRHDELLRAYRPHFATCPSTRGRLPRPRPPAETECTICGRPLHPGLIAAGERTHGCRTDRDPLCPLCGWVLDPLLVRLGHTTHLEDSPP